SPSGRAAEHLRSAWANTYGRDPSPSKAYGDAVRAVEAAAKPVISPKNSRTTLGTLIRDIRAKPGKWTVTLVKGAGSAAVGVLVEMMDLLWQGQHDRHGTSDETVRANV